LPNSPGRGAGKTKKNTPVAQSQQDRTQEIFAIEGNLKEENSEEEIGTRNGN
jgi:hypothetical protein